MSEDMREDLAGRSKRQLLERLMDEIGQWNGVEPPGRMGERQLREIMDLLERCTLFTNERHWLAMFELWLGDACRKPTPGLRELWLEAMSDWLAYMSDRDMFADEPPRRR